MTRTARRWEQSDFGQRELRRIVLPGIEQGRAASRDVDGIADGEIEVVLEGGGGEEGVDEGRRVAGSLWLGGLQLNGSPTVGFAGQGKAIKVKALKEAEQGQAHRPIGWAGSAMAFLLVVGHSGAP
jgi:hypothetical protein